MRNNLLWITVGVAIALTHLFRYWLTKLNGLDVFWDLPLVGDIRYADYLIQKWFLVIVSFSIFGWWLTKQKRLLETVKANLPFVLLIFLVTFGVHFFSFQRWFEFDDYRVIGHHYAVEGTSSENEMGAGSSYYYGIGLVYLVVGWFNTIFELYNSLGLLIYSLIGIVVFLIGRKLGINKFISLLVALFFVTSPTYWRETLIMLELLGDGFKLLLFSISILLLLSKFYPGSVIFAAAALEFGISRTHFIGLPLMLICIFFKDRQSLFMGKQFSPRSNKQSLFSPRSNKQKRLSESGGSREWIVSLIAFFVMSFLYVKVLGTHPPKVLDMENWANNWSQLLRISDTIFGVMVPHSIAVTLLAFFNWAFDKHPYISPILGLSLASFFVILSFLLLRRKNFLPSKLIFLGIAIVVSAIIFPTLMGIRLTYKIESLTAQYQDIVPAAPTSYGVFSTFGTIFILVGLARLVKESLFKRVLISLIIFNSITIFKSDIAWAKEHSYPQRMANQQLNDLLPYDGKIKVIYTPPPTQVLSRYISYFYQLYRIRETLHFTNEPKEFIRLVEEGMPEKENVFVLTLDTKSHQIIDHSVKIRTYYPEKKLTPEILGEFSTK